MGYRRTLMKLLCYIHTFDGHILQSNCSNWGGIHHFLTPIYSWYPWIQTIHEYNLSPFFWLVGGFKHFWFSIIYGMSSFPLTNSYLSRWLKPRSINLLIIGMMLYPQLYNFQHCCYCSHHRKPFTSWTRHNNGWLESLTVGGLELDFFEVPIILGISSSQLTSSHFFSEGQLYHQPDYH